MEVSAGWELRTFCEHLPCNLMHPGATWWHYIPHGFRVIELLKGDENSLVMRRSGVQIPEAALWIWIVLRVSGNIRGTLLVESLACD